MADKTIYTLYVMRFIFLLLLIFSVKLASAQSDTVFIKHSEGPYSDVLKYKTDTLVFDSFFKNKILYGTMVLPDTRNQMIAKYYGISLDKVSITECENNDFEPPQNDKILSIKESKDSLIVETLYVGNCCHSFLCDVEIIDNTINLITHGYGTYCSCVCGYYLTFYFSRFDLDEYRKLRYIAIDNNPETRKAIR